MPACAVQAGDSDSLLNMGTLCGNPDLDLDLNDGAIE